MTDPSSCLPVLLLAPNWLGDSVMFTPAIEHLHQHRHLGDGRTLTLHLAVREAWAPLFEQDPRLASIIPVDRGGKHGGWLGGFRLGRDLRALNPAAILLGPPSLRAGLAAYISGAEHRVGYAGDRRSLLLTGPLPAVPRGALHHGQELLALAGNLLERLGMPAAVPGEGLPETSLPGCAGLEAPGGDHRPYWVLAPGATYGSAKSWPLPPATHFVREALANQDLRMVLLGDVAAGEFCRQLAADLGVDPGHDLDGPAALVDLTGRTDLARVVSLLKGAQVFVGNDSGLMHLAAALGRPTVGIFGSSNPHWTRPLGPRTRVMVPTGFDCRPCYLKTCNQPQFCLETVSGEEVLAAAKGLLEGD